MNTFSKESHETLLKPFIIHYSGGNKHELLQVMLLEVCCENRFPFGYYKMRLENAFVLKGKKYRYQNIQII